MPISKQQVIDKAEATIQALAGMSSKERERMPTSSFAEDFNKCRKLALELCPEIEPLAPPQIDISSNGWIIVVRANYVEIDAYYRQLRDLVAGHNS